MDLSQLIAIAPTIALVLLGVACLLLLWSLAMFRRARSNVFWRQRRQSGRRGLRALLFGVTLIAVSGLVCLSNVIVPRLLPLTTATLPATSVAVAATPQPTVGSTAGSTATALPAATDSPSATTEPPTLAATASVMATQTLISIRPSLTNTFTSVPATRTTLPSATATASATRTLTASPTSSPTRTFTSTAAPTSTASPTATTTPTLTASPTATLTRTATMTPTVTPTYTPTETLIPLGRISTLRSDVTPSPIARLTIIALDSQISPDQKPVAPGTTFPQGIRRIFFFVEFSAMRNGMIWRRELRYNGETVQDSEFLWGLQESGTAYFFVGQPTGFPAGNYELRLYVGSSVTPISAAAFSVS